MDGPILALTVGVTQLVLEGGCLELLLVDSLTLGTTYFQPKLRFDIALC